MKTLFKEYGIHHRRPLHGRVRFHTLCSNFREPLGGVWYQPPLIINRQGQPLRVGRPHALRKNYREGPPKCLLLSCSPKSVWSSCSPKSVWSSCSPKSVWSSCSYVISYSTSSHREGPPNSLPRNTHKRNYSSSSLSQLVSDINLVCNDLQRANRLCIPPLKLKTVKDQILTNSYTLSPLRVEFIEQEYYIARNLKDSPEDLTVNTSIVGIVSPSNPEDSLVLLALSVSILRVLKGSLPINGYRLVDGVDAFYDAIRQIGKAERVFKIVLIIAPRFTPLCAVERIIERYIKRDDPIYHFITSFLNLPILDRNGNDRKGSEDFDCIPEVGEMKTLLWELVFMEIVDQLFPKHFPGIRFLRFHDELYIFASETDTLDKFDLHRFIRDIPMLGLLESMGKGEKPLICYHKQHLYLGADGVVQLGGPD